MLCNKVGSNITSGFSKSRCIKLQETPTFCQFTFRWCLDIVLPSHATSYGSQDWHVRGKQSIVVLIHVLFLFVWGFFWRGGCFGFCFIFKCKCCSIYYLFSLRQESQFQHSRALFAAKTLTCQSRGVLGTITFWWDHFKCSGFVHGAFLNTHWNGAIVIIASFLFPALTRQHACHEKDLFTEQPYSRCPETLTPSWGKMKLRHQNLWEDTATHHTSGLYQYST